MIVNSMRWIANSLRWLCGVQPPAPPPPMKCAPPVKSVQRVEQVADAIAGALRFAQEVLERLEVASPRGSAAHWPILGAVLCRELGGVPGPDILAACDELVRRFPGPEAWLERCVRLTDWCGDAVQGRCICRGDRLPEGLPATFVADRDAAVRAAGLRVHDN